MDAIPKGNAGPPQSPLSTSPTMGSTPASAGQPQVVNNYYSNCYFDYRGTVGVSGKLPAPLSSAEIMTSMQQAQSMPSPSIYHAQAAQATSTGGEGPVNDFQPSMATEHIVQLKHSTDSVGLAQSLMAKLNPTQPHTPLSPPTCLRSRFKTALSPRGLSAPPLGGSASSPSTTTRQTAVTDFFRPSADLLNDSASLDETAGLKDASSASRVSPPRVLENPRDDAKAVMKELDCIKSGIKDTVKEVSKLQQHISGVQSTVDGNSKMLDTMKVAFGSQMTTINDLMSPLADSLELNRGLRHQVQADTCGVVSELLDILRKDDLRELLSMISEIYGHVVPETASDPTLLEYMALAAVNVATKKDCWDIKDDVLRLALSVKSLRQPNHSDPNDVHSSGHGDQGFDLAPQALHLTLPALKIGSKRVQRYSGHTDQPSQLVTHSQILKTIARVGLTSSLSMRSLSLPDNFSYAREAVSTGSRTDTRLLRLDQVEVDANFSMAALDQVVSDKERGNNEANNASIPLQPYPSEAAPATTHLLADDAHKLEEAVEPRQADTIVLPSPKPATVAPLGSPSPNLVIGGADDCPELEQQTEHESPGSEVSKSPKTPIHSTFADPFQQFASLTRSASSSSGSSAASDKNAPIFDMSKIARLQQDADGDGSWPTEPAMNKKPEVSFNTSFDTNWTEAVASNKRFQAGTQQRPTTNMGQDAQNDTIEDKENPDEAATGGSTTPMMGASHAAGGTTTNNKHPSAPETQTEQKKTKEKPKKKLTSAEAFFKQQKKQQKGKTMSPGLVTAAKPRNGKKGGHKGTTRTSIEDQTDHTKKRLAAISKDGVARVSGRVSM